MSASLSRAILELRQIRLEGVQGSIEAGAERVVAAGREVSAMMLNMDIGEHVASSPDLHRFDADRTAAGY